MNTVASDLVRWIPKHGFCRVGEIAHGANTTSITTVVGEKTIGVLWTRVVGQAKSPRDILGSKEDIIRILAQTGSQKSEDALKAKLEVGDARLWAEVLRDCSGERQNGLKQYEIASRNLATTYLIGFLVVREKLTLEGARKLLEPTSVVTTPPTTSPSEPPKPLVPRQSVIAPRESDKMPAPPRKLPASPPPRKPVVDKLPVQPLAVTPATAEAAPPPSVTLPSAPPACAPAVHVPAPRPETPPASLPRLACPHGATLSALEAQLCALTKEISALRDVVSALSQTQETPLAEAPAAQPVEQPVVKPAPATKNGIKKGRYWVFG